MCVLQVLKKERASLSYCARVIRAKEEGIPAVDVLRFVSPSEEIPAPEKVRDAFNSRGPEYGLELIREQTGFGASTSWECPTSPAAFFSSLRPRWVRCQSWPAKPLPSAVCWCARCNDVTLVWV